MTALTEDAPTEEVPIEEVPIEDASTKDAPVEDAGGGRDRRVASLRRGLLHLGLGAWTTPLTGCLWVGARALRAHRVRPWLLPGGLALTCFGLGLAFALFLPWRRTPVTLLTLALWIVGGIANAWGERRACVAPRPVEAPGSIASIGLHVALWTLAVVVSWSCYGFFLVGALSPWGQTVLLKPFFSRAVLWTVLVAFVPIGILVGLAQGLLRRPVRPAAPVVFCVSGLVLMFAVAVPGWLYEWILEDVAKIEGRYAFMTPFEGPWMWVWTASLLLLALPFLIVSVYLAEATGVRDFLRRGLVGAGLGLALIVNSEVLDHSRILDLRAHLAVEAAEAEEHQRAAEHWAWVVQRLGRRSQTAQAARWGAREALLAGDPGLARELLESVDEPLAQRDDVPRAQVVSETLLERLPATGSELGPVHAVDVTPVRRESYLSAPWATLLTAVRTARPELGETALKLRLLDLSQSSEQIVLGDLETLRDLEVRARFFDTELIAFRFRQRDEALRRGVPVMYRNPHGSGWHLVIWSHPESGAVIELDYDLWKNDDDDGNLERSEIEQLVAGDEDVERFARRIRVRIGRLEAGGLLEEELEPEGGWALAVVTPETRDELMAALDTSPRALEDLITLDEAWALYRQGANHRALDRLAERTADDRADELLAVMWLETGRREAMDPETAARAERAHDRLLSPEGLEAASRNALEALRQWTDPTFEARWPGSPRCKWRLAVAEASVQRAVKSADARGELFQAALDQGRTEDALTWARALWRHSTGDVESLRIAASLAAMPEAESVPGLPELLEEIRSQVGLMIEIDGAVRFRRWMPEHWAVQAVLETDPRTRRQCWQRACELDPHNPAYFERRAAADEAMGDREAARWARARARSLTPTRPCEEVSL